MRMFEVGGCVRDEILGRKSKDIDYTVVLDHPFYKDGYDRDGNTPFEAMSVRLRRQGFHIFLLSPEYLTVRARFPKGHANEKLTADFVLARKESDYTDGRRPDNVEIGTLEDDLSRRDFTMNAIAKSLDTGKYIDPHGGISDVSLKRIRCVGDPEQRLAEDALRAVRALRFSVVLGFHIDLALCKAMESEPVVDSIVNNIADERISVELSKMFGHDTVKSIHLLSEFPLLTEAMFSGKVSLDSTMKQR